MEFDDLAVVPSRRKQRTSSFRAGLSPWFTILLLAIGPGCDPDANAPPQRRVIVYTALDRSFSEPILDEFERRTGIQALVVYDTESTKSIGLANKIIAERNRPRCDVYWNNEIINTLLLKREGLLRPTRPPNALDYSEEVRDPDGFWYGFAARARVLIVNTESVPKRDWPKSMYDLLDPNWNGRIGIAKPTAGTTATHVACLFAQIGPDRAKEYLNKLKANGVRIESGNKSCAENVASGALAVAWTDTDDAIMEVDARRPVAIIFPDNTADDLGTLLIPNTLAAIKGSPNPAEAELLIDYLLSPHVETTLAEGPSAQIPLNSKCSVVSRAAPPESATRQNVDFEEAASHWAAAQEYIRKVFLR